MSIVQATRCANAIPLTDFALYQTYQSFDKVMTHEKKTISEL